MKKLLISIIENNLDYPIYLQGSLLETEPYPTDFFTFWNNATEYRHFYDDKPQYAIWDFDLNFYSTSPEKTNTILTQANKFLLENKFIINGKGYDLPSGVSTHTGRGENILYLEVLKND